MSCRGCYYENKETEVSHRWDYMEDKMDCKGLYDPYMCNELRKLGELKRKNETNKDMLDCWKPLLERQKIVGY